MTSCLLYVPNHLPDLMSIGLDTFYALAIRLAGFLPNRERSMADGKDNPISQIFEGTV
jgi:hypothetical protein